MSASRIVVDSSAIIAILQAEPERSSFIDALDNSGDAVCSMVTFVESFMVSMQRKTNFALPLYASFLDDFGIRAVALDRDQADAASEAFIRFGKGRHPAGLNMGDCFSYALARSLNAPLLYKGNDFGKTDIASAMATGARP